MLNRRRFLAVLLGPAFIFVLVLPPGGAFAAGSEARAGAFIQSLFLEAIESLTQPDTSREERIKRFRRLFNAHFAVRSIGKFVLGRHWRKASKDEQAEYLNLFEDLMVVSYVDRFQRYAGKNLNILKTRAEKGSAVTVFTEITRPGGAKPAQVLWRIGARGEIMKILDVIVEGVSMSQTLRSDFGSIIRRKNGKVSGLLKELRVKTASLKAEKSN
ncbi:MAG: toluene tolerance protein [Rhodospirillaceae bacterium]|jgi:phospholipid transport system substrate-binding protein|nr:toluene tolerance protein [Rhodospirillaceae bacterium]|tara:strand:+ start:922 stop:1566 length:645 start_codon:yes stop_codon:yes gene_type:complete